MNHSKSGFIGKKQEDEPTNRGLGRVTDNDRDECVSHGQIQVVVEAEIEINKDERVRNNTTTQQHHLLKMTSDATTALNSGAAFAS